MNEQELNNLYQLLNSSSANNCQLAFKIGEGFGYSELELLELIWDTFVIPPKDNTFVPMLELRRVVIIHDEKWYAAQNRDWSEIRYDSVIKSDTFNYAIRQLKGLDHETRKYN